MRLLFWKEDKKRPAYSGKRFQLFRVRWDKRLRKTVLAPNSKRWGLHHPSDGRIIMLRRDPSQYGRVVETPDISTRVALGTPTLGVGVGIAAEVEDEKKEEEE